MDLARPMRKNFINLIAKLEESLVVKGCYSYQSKTQRLIKWVGWKTIGKVGKLEVKELYHPDCKVGNGSSNSES